MAARCGAMEAAYRSPMYWADRVMFAVAHVVEEADLIGGYVPEVRAAALQGISDAITGKIVYERTEAFFDAWREDVSTEG